MQIAFIILVVWIFKAIVFRSAITTMAVVGCVLMIVMIIVMTLLLVDVVEIVILVRVRIN